ncbi:hypothetical protein EJ08DRAFT_701311 [Tothia fuscella]|uniref:Nephrocystin 3-like N-terminal domain-containing protein n=1 Tax=Tothia fuscella TaxID=1048955 RepID=A0A9P4NJ51_9PEZI|nr:hypothetical protein EJ08DRAFT_701311 [Tothia fuscella]
MVDGSDSNLGGAYKDMERAINELSEAVNLVTLRTVDIIAELVRDMSDDVEFIVSKVTVIDERTHATHSNTNIIMKQGDEIAAKQDVALTKVDELLQVNREFRDLVTRTLQEQTEGFDRAAERQKEQHAQKRSKTTDPADKKRDALNQIKAYFSGRSWDLSAVTKEAKIQRNELDSTHVHGTGDWLAEDDAYSAWFEEKSSVLWLRGTAGIGKSYLALNAVSQLEARRKEDGSKTLATFFFREEIHHLATWDGALCYLAYQLAEQDSKYAEQLAIEVSNDESEDSMWKRLFADRLSKKSECNVCLVLDGVDEMSSEQQEEATKCIRQVVDESLNIQILVTSRTTMAGLTSLSVRTVDITTQKMANDISHVIKAGLKSLARLRKFRKPVKSVILKKLRSKADGMRYVEHMLRRLSYIGREKAVLKDLEKHLPDSLDALYALMLSECQRDRTVEQYMALKKLFAWLAYSKRALTLGEASELVAMTASEDVFEIEDELIGRSARILELARTDEHEDDEADDRVDDSAEEDSYGDSNHDMKDNGASPLTFQERSLREYFRAVDVDQQGLRTAPSAAHLVIFEMCANILFTGATRPNVNNVPDLKNYAASYFVKHLAEIDVDKASNEEVERVVQKLQKIFQNHNNVARVLEYNTYTRYSDMEGEDDSTGPMWLHKVKQWVDRALLLDEATRSEDVQGWAKDFTVLNALIPLAKGHVENWFREFYGPANAQCFAFAHDALALSGVDVPVGKGTVLKVADYFPDIEKTAGAMRGISAQMGLWSIPRTEILQYTNKGLEMLEPGKSALRFYLNRSLSIAHFRLNETEKSVELLDVALAALPENWRDDPDLRTQTEGAYIEKGRYLKLLNRPDEALQAYRESETVYPDKKLNGYTLFDMSGVYDEDRDPTGTKLLKLMQSWSDIDMTTFLDFTFEYDDMYAIARLEHVAGNAGEEGKDFVLGWYERYMASLARSSNSLVLAKAALATLYRSVLGDEAQGLKLLREIMKMNLADYEFSVTVEERFSDSRSELADMLHTEFRSTSDPTKKTALLTEIKNLPIGSSTALEKSQWMLYSNISPIIAMCQYTMGPGVEYQATMQGTFNNCLEGLSDSVGWNDSPSLRLLAKILSLVGGLERDALIAISLQLSWLTGANKSDMEDEDDEGNKDGEANDALSGLTEQAQALELEEGDAQPEEVTTGGAERDEANSTSIASMGPKHAYENTISRPNDKKAEGANTTVGSRRDEENTTSIASMGPKHAYDNSIPCTTDTAKGLKAEDKKSEKATATAPAQRNDENTTSIASMGPSHAYENTTSIASMGPYHAYENTNPRATEKKPEEATTRAGAEQKEQNTTSIASRGPIHVFETKISSTTVEDGKVRESNTILIEEATVDKSSSPGNNHDSTEEPAEPPVKEYALPFVEDEDLEDDGPVCCDGPCGSEWETYTEPIHLCVICTNADLCTPCLAIRRAPVKEGEEEPNFCGRNHRYLKAPIKGWRGVKDGMMRIESDDGSVVETAFTEWLAGLKNERWPKAWERFWIDHSAARDIGF